MIVVCPACDTRFEIPDEKYRPGRKARCSNCGNVFALPAADAVTPAAEDVPSPSAVADTPDPKPAARPEAVSQAAPEVQAIPDPTGDVVLPAGKKKTPSPKKRKIITALLLVLVIGLLGGGGFLVYHAFFAAPVTVEPPAQTAAEPPVPASTPPAKPSDAEAARLAVVSRLDIENVRQYMMTENEKTGPMIVIEGAVVNRFDAPKDLILLEIGLYDDKGKVLAAREQYCGPVLSLLQLRTLSKTAIESALTNQVSILSNNTNILPGGRVSFTTVFFDLPRGAYEYEVKVVDAQDPAARK